MMIVWQGNYGSISVKYLLPALNIEFCQYFKLFYTMLLVACLVTSFKCVSLLVYLLKKMCHNFFLLVINVFLLKYV